MISERKTRVIRPGVLLPYKDSKYSIDYGEQSSNVSINSKPDHPPPPPGQNPQAIFLMGEFPTPGKKEFNPPGPITDELKPHPGGAFFSIIHNKNMKKWDWNHVKLHHLSSLDD